MLEKMTRVNYLFDFYQSLLTEKQRDYMRLYYLEDHSLGEISETYDVSRQAIYDNIKRTVEMLEEYEAKLGLYDKFNRRNEIIEALNEAVSKRDDERLKALIEQLENID